MRENYLGLRETERKYNVKHSIIAKWERKYLEEGYEGLMKDNCGRPSLTGKKRGTTLRPRLAIPNERVSKIT